MSFARPRHAERRLHRAVYIAVITMALSGATGLCHSAQAASLDVTTVHSYRIDAGPLGRTLSGFAAQSGLALSFDSTLTEGLQSSGLSGSYSAQQGMQMLLANTGLQIMKKTDGSYTLVKVEKNSPVDANAQTLPVVQVTASMDATTEGTGSYTSGSANTATRLNLSLRETPQSVSVITRQRIDDQGLSQLSDVVLQTPGLTMSADGNTGSDSSPIYARGFQVENYQIDGVGQLYSNYSSIFQSNDMALYDHVEVVRGATGLMNGIGLPGATINMIRKRPTKTFQASAKVEAGSWNYYRADADISVPLNETGTLRGRMIAAYQENDSYIDRLHEKKKILSGIVEADIAPATMATVGFTLQEQDATGHARAGLPRFFSDGSKTHWSRSDSAAASWASSDRNSQSAFASLEHYFDNEWQVKGTYTYSKSKYDEVLGYAAAYGAYPDKTTGAGSKLWAGRWAGAPEQNSLDLYATGPLTLFGRKHDLVVGMNSTYTKDETVGYGLWWLGTWDSAISNIFTWDGNTPAEPVNPANSDIAMRERTNSAYTSARFKPSDALSVILGARYTKWGDR